MFTKTVNGNAYHIANVVMPQLLNATYHATNVTFDNFKRTINGFDALEFINHDGNVLTVYVQEIKGSNAWLVKY